MGRNTRAVVPEKRGLKREEAAQYVGISPSKFDQLVERGDMPKPFKIDGRLVWDWERVDAAFSELSERDRGDTGAWDKALGA